MPVTVMYVPDSVLERHTILKESLTVSGAQSETTYVVINFWLSQRQNLIECHDHYCDTAHTVVYKAKSKANRRCIQVLF